MGSVDRQQRKVRNRVERIWGCPGGKESFCVTLLLGGPKKKKKRPAGNTAGKKNHLGWGCQKKVGGASGKDQGGEHLSVFYVQKGRGKWRNERCCLGIALHQRGSGGNWAGVLKTKTPLLKLPRKKKRGTKKKSKKPASFQIGEGAQRCFFGALGGGGGEEQTFNKQKEQN